MHIQSSQSSLVVIRVNDSFILQKRSNIPDISEPGKLSLFGGAIEPFDASPQAAAARELHEETSLDFNLADLEHIATLTMQASDKQQSDDITHYFYIRLDEERINVYEGDGIQKIPINADLNTLDLSPEAKLILLRLQERTKHVRNN